MRLKLSLFWSAVLVLGACTSSHDLRKDGNNPLGGGYYEATVREGVYFIHAKTNFSPWVNSGGALKMWRRRAEALCGSSSFRDLGISTSSYQDRPSAGAPYVITVREGFAICTEAGVTDEQAVEAIRKGCPRYGRPACEL